MEEPRYARIGVWEGNGDDLERWVAQCERVKRGVQAQAGNCGAFFLLDRESGRALTLTLWESEAARAASEAFRTQSQDTTSDRTGARVSTERYDVVACFPRFEVEPCRPPDPDCAPAGYRPARVRSGE